MQDQAGGPERPPAELDDEALAARIAAGDRDAFGVVYDRYARRIHAWAAHMLGSDQAEDALQEVFLKLWSKAAQFDPARGRFGAWFMAVARHHLVQEAARAGNQQRLRAAQEIEVLLAGRPDPGAEVEVQVGRRELAEVVAAAIRELPPEQRRVLVLAYFGGLSQSEIAARLRLPLGTVKKRVRLGMQKLRAAAGDPGGPTEAKP